MRKPTAPRGFAFSLSASQRRTRVSSRSSSGEIERSSCPSNGSTSRQVRPPCSIIDSENPSDCCSALNSLIAAVASCSRLDRAPARHTLAPSDASEARTLSASAEGSKTSSASPGAVNQRLPTCVRMTTAGLHPQTEGPGAIILSDSWFPRGLVAGIRAVTKVVRQAQKPSRAAAAETATSGPNGEPQGSSMANCCYISPRSIVVFFRLGRRS